MSAYLDKAGLAHLWGKIQQQLDEKTGGAVTVPDGGGIEMGYDIGDGPYTFEFVPEEDMDLEQAAEGSEIGCRDTARSS